jgi:hypothetical protein
VISKMRHLFGEASDALIRMGVFRHGVTLFIGRIGEDPFTFVKLGAVGAADALTVFGLDVDVCFYRLSQLARLGCRNCHHLDSPAGG